MAAGCGACSPGRTELPSAEVGKALGVAGWGADQEFGHMYQTSSGDMEQMVRYRDLEFDREIWAGDLTGEVKVRRLSETPKGRNVIQTEEQGLCLDAPI